VTLCVGCGPYCAVAGATVAATSESAKAPNAIADFFTSTPVASESGRAV